MSALRENERRFCNSAVVVRSGNNNGYKGAHGYFMKLIEVDVPCAG